MATDHDQLANVEDYGGYNNSRPSALLNSIFMATVNRAAKTLVAVASTSSAEAQNAEKWKPADHMRFMFMLMTWMVVWVLRILMDHFPCSVLPSQYPSHLLLTDHDGFSPMATFSLPSSSVPSLSSTLSSLDLVLHQGSNTEPSSVKALGRALSHVFALLNETPASSRKYQFAVAMADKIVEENASHGHEELLQINRTALASAFARTAGLLYRSLQQGSSSQSQSQSQSWGVDDYSAGGSWSSCVIKTLPLGTYFASYLKSGLNLCLGTIFPGFGTGQRRRRQVGAGEDEISSDIIAEKHAHELLWITNKLRSCGALDEALMQWSLASGIASLSLTANPRVQGFIVKISAILIGELTRGDLEVPRQIKFRLLVLWLPLFCYAENGLAYPVLTGYEKGEMERTMDQVISTLPALDQELILTNWLQDFTISTSDWPNLQISYDRWCCSTRKLITIS